MKILLLDVCCKYTSTGRIVYDIYKVLNDGENEVAIGYGRGPLLDEKNIIRHAPKMEVYFHALMTRITGYTGYFSPISTKRLIKFIEEFKPDIVHLHEMHGYYVNILPLVDYLKKNDIKSVWTQHCEFMYTGKCGYAYDCIKWETECGNCPALKDYPKTYFFDRTKKMFLAKKKAFSNWDDVRIVTPSPWLDERVSRSFLKNKKRFVVFNGVDTSIFHYKEKEANELRDNLGLKNKKVILAVAPDFSDKRKGGKFVLELANKMPDIMFAMVGDNVPENRNQNIINIGVVHNPHELAQYYSMADIFLLCSERETYSMTTVEALCCGTKVVGFKAGAPETIAIKKYSSFVEYADIEMLENEIRRVICLEDETKEHISQEAISVYSKERMVEEYFNIYKDLYENKEGN